MFAPTRRMSIPRILLLVLVGTLAVGGGFAPAPALAQESAEEARTHTVRQGDTLYSISRRYDVSIEQIRRLNNLEGNAISIGQVLRLTPDDAAVPDGDESEKADTTDVAAAEDPPAAAGAAGDQDLAADAAVDSTAAGFVVSTEGEIGRVLVGAGKPLMEIAIRFAIHPDSLIALNPDIDDPLTEDTEIRVPSDRLVRIVTVRRGDTLFSIGRAHGVSVEQLRDVNELESDNLAVGRSLRVPVDIVDPDDIRPAAPVNDIIPAAAYPASYSGRRLLDGRTYDPEDFVVSHPDLPIGTTVLVTIPENGASAFAVVADRAAGGSTDLMDISAAVAAALNMSRSGTRLLEVRIVD